ncbi:MAG TPA: MarR family transcriptional regulator [Alphaproteobacteria bacterium]|nr:MarR family transcriptional regulator [Alphaproteobacteria bacterium]
MSAKARATISTGPRTARGRALYDLVPAIARAFFRMRALGIKEDAVTPSGRGAWGLMRSLAEGGPQTVPALARQRPVSRQHIQKLADELARRGLVEFVDNPAHRRSKLVRLTPKGARRYARVNARVGAICDALARESDEAELLAAARALRRLIAALDARLAR